MLELTLQWASKPMQIYIINEESQVNNRSGSHWSHNTRRFTEVDVWCSQFNQVWHHIRCSDYTKELKNWLNQQRIIHHSRCVWDSEQSEMSLSEHKSWDHEILLLNDKQSKWMHYTQWVKINSRKSELTLMRISKENSSDHQSHWQNTQFCLYQKEWHKATMCQLQTTQQDN
jgi:hypothetical protein